MTYIHVSAIWLAVVALALRTIEEGVRPHREIERYRHYRAAIQNVARKFDRDGLSQKTEAILDLERVSFDEMVSFFKSNQESRFVM